MSSNLAGESTLADGPPWSIKHGSLEDHYTIWQMNLLWPMAPQSIEHGSLADHYTIWQMDLLQPMDPPVNQAWISGRPIHQIIFIID